MLLTSPDLVIAPLLMWNQVTQKHRQSSNSNTLSCQALYVGSDFFEDVLFGSIRKG